MNQLTRIFINKQQRKFFFSYFIPLFSLSTLPSLQFLFKVSLLPQWISIISITSITLLYTFTVFYILRLTQNILLSKKKKTLVFSLSTTLLLLFLLAFLHKIFFQGYSYSLKDEFLLWIMHTGRYLLLSLFFLGNPYPLFQQINSFNHSPEDKFPKSCAIALNALILPLLYSLFGSFHNGLLYVGLQDTSNNSSTYNNYLFIGDSFAFNSFMLLLAFPNLISIFFNIYSTYSLSLIGSRISTISSIFFVISSTLIFIFFDLSKSIKASLSLKKGWKIKLLTCLFVLSLIGIFLGNLDKKDLTEFSEYLFSSRVGESLFEFETSNDKLEDESLSSRLSLFQCHLNNMFSKPDIVIFGQPWEESDCGNYIHSLLSIFFEQGLVVFLILLFTIYLCIVSLKSAYQTKKRSEVSRFYLLLIFLLTFSLISIFARKGLGYFLPAYIFSYSVTKQMKLKSDN